MSSVQALREFINERLTAAAGEIFTVFEQTIIQYEEEIDRQRKLLQINCKPQIKFHRTEDAKRYLCEDEQLSDQETNFSLDQEELEPLEIKDDLEELGAGQQHDPLSLKEETDIFMGPPTGEQAPAPGPEQLCSRGSAVAASRDQRRRERGVAAPARNYELSSNQRHPTDEVDNDPMAGNLGEAEPDKKCLQCGICGKTFKCASQMLLHHRIHTGEKPHSCPTCGKRFNQKHHLKNHMIIHTDEKPHFCESCNKGFKHKSSYLSHLKIHKGEKPHACDACGKRFGERGNLLVHMRCHTNERPFFCETCGKSYKYRNYLLVHMRTHTGERPFLCNTCGKRFSTSSALYKHGVVHTGERPFSCGTCGKSFSVHDTLLRHMTTHTGVRKVKVRE